MSSYIPEKFYVGYQSRGEDQLLGFMTPIKGDSSDKKRKQSVDRWSSDKLPKTEIPNTDLEGFRVIDYSSRSSTSNVYWRILHPAGFEFEISSGNFMHLLQECDISEGEFAKKLLFVRNGIENFLTYRDSKTYKSANTSKQEITKIPLKNVQLGDKITLKNGSKGIYMGFAHVARYHYDGSLHDKTVKKYFIKHEGWSKRDKRDIIDSMSSLHVINIDEKTDNPMTKREALNELQNCVLNRDQYKFTEWRIVGILEKETTVDSMEFKMLEITKDKYESICSSGAETSLCLLKINGIDEYCIHDHRHYYGYNKCSSSTDLPVTKIEFVSKKTKIITLKEPSKWRSLQVSSTPPLVVDKKDITNYYFLYVSKK